MTFRLISKVPYSIYAGANSSMNLFLLHQLRQLLLIEKIPQLELNFPGYL